MKGKHETKDGVIVHMCANMLVGEFVSILNWLYIGDSQPGVLTPQEVTSSAAVGRVNGGAVFTLSQHVSPSNPITSGQLSRGLFAPCLSTRAYMCRLYSALLSYSLCK